MRKETLEYLITAKDQASKKFEAVGKSSQKATRGLQSMVPTSKQVGIGFLGISAAAIAMGTKMVQSAAQVETLMTSFEVMTGSVETATKLMKDLDTFANTTPFENLDVRSSAKTLMAFGIEAQNVQGELKSIGDVASGAGVPLNELAAIYGKTMAKGKAQAEELNQMVERGIPILEVLGEEYNATGAEIFEMASKGKITGDIIAKAFKTMTGEGGKFENMMEKQSQTVAGKWSTLMGSVGLTMQKLGEQLLPAVGPALDAVIALVQAINNALDSGAVESFIKNVGSAFNTMKDIYNGVKNFITTTIDAVKQTHEDLKTGIEDTITSISDFIGEKLEEINQFYEDHKEVINGVAILLTTIFAPAIINTGIQAGIAAGVMASKFIVAVVNAGVQGGISASVGMASFLLSIGKLIVQSGIAAIELGVKLVGSIINMGIQGGITAVTGMASLIGSVVQYAIEGWKMVAVMAAKLIKFALLATAFVIQTAITIAQTVATVALTAATWLLNVAMAILTSPIFLVVLAIVALIAIGVLLWKNWDKIKEKGKEVIEKIKVMWEGLKTRIGEIAQGLYEKLTEPFTKAWDKIKEIAEKIRGAIADAFNMDKRNSPSINDRLNTLKSGVQATLDSVTVPQYSHDIAQALAPTQQEQNTNNVTFNNTINSGLDIETVNYQLAISLENRGMF